MTSIKYGNLVTPRESAIKGALYDKLLMEVK